MKVLQQNLNDWFRHEAHVVAGDSFQMDDCSCLPVVPESRKEEEMPVGFLVTHGDDVTYVPAQTPNGEQILTAWSKLHTLELVEETKSLPAEYWYG